jgi:hypothetical protein
MRTAHTVAELRLSMCGRCGKYALWMSEKLVYPVATIAPAPNDDLPAAIRGDYEEAAAVLSASPRASCALLRLAIQKLCKELGEDARDLNSAIGALVMRGLPERVQRALDVVRVVGNNAVHPGEMDLTDDTERARALFTLVNLIVQSMITEPRQVQELYDALPDGALKAIQSRDGAK